MRWPAGDDDAADIAGVERHIGVDGAHAVVTEAREKVLRHWPIVAELHGVMANVVPARDVERPQYLVAIDRAEAVLWLQTLTP